MPFDLSALRVPILAAPMAGGPSTPELVAAVTDAGGLGVLAAGYATAGRLADDITRTRALTDAPFGVNVFVLADDPVDEGAIAAYGRRLADDAAALGVSPGTALWDDDDLDDKLAVITAARPAVISFTFGCPPAATLAELHAIGIATMVTVTDVAEARAAAARGAQTLAVQGAAAGGHRGTFDQNADPAEVPLRELVAAVRGATALPVAAAGGLASAADVRGVLAAGASAAQVGTALLLADEAGTNRLHRRALHDPSLTDTVVTRAFTGRPARALRNAFTEAHADAPPGYPQIHHLTAPLRAAAVQTGDMDRAHFWAGTGFPHARAAPAAEIVAALTA